MRKYRISDFMMAFFSVVLLCGTVGCQAADPRVLGAEENQKNGFEIPGVCMIYDDTDSDKSTVNEPAFAALQKAEDALSISSFSIGQKNKNDGPKNIDSLVERGCPLIIGAGFLMADTIRYGARHYPGTNFVILDSRLYEDDSEDNQPLTLPNVKPLLFDASEPSLLAGYLSAAMSKTGVVATYGGISALPVRNMMDGFSLGVELYAQENRRPIRLLGWDRQTQEGSFVNDFVNIGAAKRITDKFLDQKADVIFPVAGEAGQGTLLALIPDERTYVIGSDRDWASNYPDFTKYVLTSVKKNITNALFDAIAASTKGSFNSNPYIGNMSNGGVELLPLYSHESEVPTAVLKRLEYLRQEMLKGSIKINNHTLTFVCT